MINIHKEAIDRLYESMTKGEISADECREGQLEHARMISLIESAGGLVKTLMDHPKVVEAIVVGVLHLLKLHGVGGRDGE